MIPKKKSIDIDTKIIKPKKTKEFAYKNAITQTKKHLHA